MILSVDIEKLKENERIRSIERRIKLETEWDSTYFINELLSMTEYDIDPWRIHIKLGEYRYCSLYFHSSTVDDVSCIFNSIKHRLNFRMFNDGKVLQYFSTTGRGLSKSKDPILISDLEDKDAAFSLSTVYEDIPLMVRYVELYKKLDLLRRAIYNDIKLLQYYDLKETKINLEDYRCLLLK